MKIRQAYGKVTSDPTQSTREQVQGYGLIITNQAAHVHRAVILKMR